MTTDFIYLGDTIIGERPLGGARTNYATDALGSVTGTLVGGALQNTYAYKPYGAQLQKTGAGPDPSFKWVGAKGYRPTGRTFAESYVRARTTSTATCRWLTVDPNWPDQPAYLYVDSNPVSIADPSGLIKLKVEPSGPIGPTPEDCQAFFTDRRNRHVELCSLACATSIFYDVCVAWLCHDLAWYDWARDGFLCCSDYADDDPQAVTDCSLRCGDGPYNPGTGPCP